MLSKGKNSKGGLMKELPSIQEKPTREYNGHQNTINEKKKYTMFEHNMDVLKKFTKEKLIQKKEKSFYENHENKVNKVTQLIQEQKLRNQNEKYNNQSSEEELNNSCEDIEDNYNKVKQIQADDIKKSLSPIGSKQSPQSNEKKQKQQQYNSSKIQSDSSNFLPDQFKIPAEKNQLKSGRQQQQQPERFSQNPDLLQQQQQPCYQNISMDQGHSFFLTPNQSMIENSYNQQQSFQLSNNLNTSMQSSYDFQNISQNNSSFNNTPNKNYSFNCQQVHYTPQYNQNFVNLNNSMIQQPIYTDSTCSSKKSIKQNLSSSFYQQNNEEFYYDGFNQNNYSFQQDSHRSYQGQQQYQQGNQQNRRFRGHRNQPVEDCNGSEYDINPRVLSDDGRTTLMIKNIPNQYSLKVLLAIFDKNFAQKYDFFYLPIDFQNKCNVGYAFINFVHSKHIKPFLAEFNNQKWKNFWNSSKIAQIKYARIQGRKSMEDHFHQTIVMNKKDKKYKPQFFTFSQKNAVNKLVEREKSTIKQLIDKQRENV